jgi:hypothetical protein
LDLEAFASLYKQIIVVFTDVDPSCTVAGASLVPDQEGVFFDALCVQTDVNIKKFFVLQLVAAEKNKKNPEAGQDSTSGIEKGKVVAGGVRIENGKVVAAGNDYYVFTRWGREGELGRCMTYGPFNRYWGESEFKKIFKDKTGNEWDQRTAPPKPYKYICSAASSVSVAGMEFGQQWGQAKDAATERKIAEVFHRFDTDGCRRFNNSNT